MTDPMNAAALLQQASELEQRGRLAEAIAGCRKILAREPGNVDALVLLGQALLRGGDVEAAGQALRKAVALKPGHAAGQTLLGIVLSSRGQLQEALACFDRALKADPASAMALIYQADALATLGRNEEAVAAFDRALALAPQNMVLWNNRALALEALGRDDEAAQSYRRALALRPDVPEIHCSLANALNRLGSHEEAVEHYRQAIARRADLPRAHANLGNSLFALERWEEALPSLQQALRLEPNDAKLHDAVGLTLRRLQRDQESLASFDRALALAPDDAEIIGNKAGALVVLGRLDEARHLIERAIALDPGNANFYTPISRMKRFTADDPMIATIEALLQDKQTQPPERQIPLLFALAKIYDDIGERQRAFPYLVQANALVRGQLDYDESAAVASLDIIADVFTPQLIRDKAGQGDPSERPIFIVGMPRSGTTLVEQILASHPDVFGAGEQKKFGDAVVALTQPGQPGHPTMVPGLTANQLQALGAAYLSKMAAVVPDERRFTDKMPANFNFVGLIHLALPNARIIHLQRNPIDTCLSMFSIQFAEPIDYTYDLGELGRYYPAYERLMDHWRRVLPEGIMLDVHYEDVVGDIESQARRMLAFCGLPWDDTCLAFHKHERAVHTASVYQVRQPIYRSSLGRWQAYANQLGPLLEALDLPPEPVAG
jgi:tetratricopeptide (TPR) repeat protein